MKQEIAAFCRGNGLYSRVVPTNMFRIDDPDDNRCPDIEVKGLQTNLLGDATVVSPIYSTLSTAQSKIQGQAATRAVSPITIVVAKSRQVAFFVFSICEKATFSECFTIEVTTFYYSLDKFKVINDQSRSSILSPIDLFFLAYFIWQLQLFDAYTLFWENYPKKSWEIKINFLHQFSKLLKYQSWTGMFSWLSSTDIDIEDRMGREFYILSSTHPLYSDHIYIIYHTIFTT